MTRTGWTMAGCTLVLAGSALALVPNSMAPDFRGTDSRGKTETLSQYRGRYVVLEWANKGCPYEQAQYGSGNMEKHQREWTARGVVWLSILSSAPGQQGNVTPEQENDYLREMHAAPTAAILDPSGTIGHLYDAKTTPHMFVIDPSGRVIYQGAFDNAPTTDPGDKAAARNYVSEALTAAMAGKPVPVAVTRPYGCSVKYGG